MNRMPFQKVRAALAVTLAMVVVALSSQTQAQNPVLAEMYGRGVHKYFAGDYMGALEAFDAAIENGSRDPRAYYYRGLVYHSTGRPEMAEDDWQKGAELEGRGEYGLLIGRSLARVQGAARLEMEEIRSVARLKAQERQEAQSRARYEAREAAEQEVLRQPGRAVTPPPAPSPAVPATPENEANPFADDQGLAEGEPTVQDENAVTNPLDEAPALAPGAEPAPEGSDPFESAPPADDPFSTDGEDPFGGEGMEDPFGGDPF